MAVKNGGCDSCSASSALLMVFVMPIPFGLIKLGVEVAVWYVPAYVACFPWGIWQLSSVYTHSFQSGAFLAKCGLDSVEKSDS